jgi:gliding motility-associated-like protein
MKLFLLVLLLIPAVVAPCQQFQKRYELMLNDSIATTVPTWVDLDNDGSLDILLVSTTSTGKNYMQFVKGDTVATPLLHNSHRLVIQSIATHVVADYNHDNKMDVIFSGLRSGIPSTVVYLNRGSFIFEEQVLPIPTFSNLKIADLDNDSQAEWIVSGTENGEPFVRILKQAADFSWNVVHDSLDVLATSIQVFDANGDGNPDIFISGEAGADSLVSTLMQNRGQLWFTPEVSASHFGNSSPGDFNYDGVFDLIMVGVNQNTEHVSKLLQSSIPSHTWNEIDPVLKEGIPFAADFTSDGLIDVSYFGKGITNSNVNVIKHLSNQEALVSNNVIHSVFGDEEYDGDLDILLVIKDTGLKLDCYRNLVSEKNRPPGKPATGIGVNIFNRTFLYWEKVADDHTNARSITYDLSTYGNNISLTGNFDSQSQRRLLAAHGNNGFQNFKLIRNGSKAISTFEVQAVDNAFHAGGLCKGGVGNDAPNGCAVTITYERVSLCSNENIRLKATAKGLWFSFAKGYLGESTELDVQSLTADTVFHFSPSQDGCAGVNVWTIAIENDTLKTEKVVKYVCTNEQIELSVEDGWTQVEWKSFVHGPLGTSTNISYTASQSDSITLTVMNNAGCKLVRKTAIEISRPQVEVSSDNVKIARGSSVRLIASGAQRYAWTPASGLDDPDIADPVASPTNTTVFTVTGFDSLNCHAAATVNVVVQEGGFIPNLFTPNDDGKNDQVRIYGMTSASGFLFTIFNREGSLVFRTSDLQQAISNGWDGRSNGTKQPPGVYFWKVQGHGAAGERLLLNGKDAGSIVLVR